jgi:hypothetical protein
MAGAPKTPTVDLIGITCITGDPRTRRAGILGGDCRIQAG